LQWFPAQHGVKIKNFTAETYDLDYAYPVFHAAASAVFFIQAE
jgi:hypothetical protein